MRNLVTGLTLAAASLFSFSAPVYSGEFNPQVREMVGDVRTLRCEKVLIKSAYADSYEDFERKVNNDSDDVGHNRAILEIEYNFSTGFLSHAEILPTKTDKSWSVMPDFNSDFKAYTLIKTADKLVSIYETKEVGEVTTVVVFDIYGEPSFLRFTVKDEEKRRFSETLIKADSGLFGCSTEPLTGRNPRQTLPW
ncbi:hypothetical protein [Salinimonas lutimaris]|uniref:hypothetical protein n=1 Tax=Salinimonas lutimaris TaxID=914153 RepID=UPI0010C01017|nr:hypothetical protein [Salinimonas lutimaris]